MSCRRLTQDGTGYVCGDLGEGEKDLGRGDHKASLAAQSGSMGIVGRAAHCRHCTLARWEGATLDQSHPHKPHEQEPYAKSASPGVPEHALHSSLCMARFPRLPYIPTFIVPRRG
jgi:hypothetical protein